MAQQGTPVVLIGRTSVVGRPVAEHLKPEYEVIHFLTSTEAAVKDLPLLLSGSKPTQKSPDGIGSQDYSQPPQAVIVGAAFTNAMVDDLRKACGGSLRVPWLTAGVNEQQRDDRMQQPMDPAKYAPVVAQKLKSAMARLREEGKWNEDGVHVYV